MRSFNKARLIDIADKSLDPYKNHTIGADGRLAASAPQQVDVVGESETKEDLPKTGFDKYFEQQLENPVFASAYEQSKQEIADLSLETETEKVVQEENSPEQLQDLEQNSLTNNKADQPEKKLDKTNKKFAKKNK